jgi:hypothetical protein
MRKAVGLATLVAIFAAATLRFGAISAHPEASPVGCPITQPNAFYATPPSHFYGGPGSYQNEALWTTIWMWGQDGIVYVPLDDRIGSDGSINSMKWAWYRFKPGEFSITGRRLDATVPPLDAWIPDYGNTPGFQSTGLIFPSLGCWEITGHLDEETLTFVVWVVPDTVNPLGTPYATVNTLGTPLATPNP